MILCSAEILQLPNRILLRISRQKKQARPFPPGDGLACFFLSREKELLANKERQVNPVTVPPVKGEEEPDMAGRDGDPRRRTTHARG